MRSTRVARCGRWLVLALPGIVISAASTGSAHAMDQRLRGAWAASASDCSRLLQNRGGGWSFRPKTTEFEQAYIISDNKVVTPSGSCNISRASRAKDKSALRLSCKNSVSYMTRDVRVTMQSDTQMTYGYTGDAVLDVSYVKCAR